VSGLRAVLIVASALWLAGAVATAPVAAQTPPQQPPSPAPAQPPSPPPAAEPPHEETQRPDSLKPGDAFGEKVDLTEQTIVYAAGSGQWDNAFPTIVNAFRQVTSYLQKQGIKPAGPAMTIYTSTNDTSFQFWAAIPVAEAPKDPPPGILVGHTTAGVAYKFVHRGSYDEMDTTYDAITNFLDEKQLDAKGLFIEQYDTDPITTPPDKLVVEVFVPVK
jgi:effector-binding domain-containing protein